MFIKVESSAQRSNIVVKGEVHGAHENNARAAYARPRALAARSWGARFDGGDRYRLLTPVRPQDDDETLWLTMLNLDRAPEGSISALARLIIYYEDSDTYSPDPPDEPALRAHTLGLELRQVLDGDVGWASASAVLATELDVVLPAYPYRHNGAQRGAQWLYALYGGSAGLDAPSILKDQHGRYDLWSREDYLQAQLVQLDLDLAGSGIDPDYPVRARLYVDTGSAESSGNEILVCYGASLYWQGVM